MKTMCSPGYHHNGFVSNPTKCIQGYEFYVTPLPHFTLARFEHFFFVKCHFWLVIYMYNIYHQNKGTTKSTMFAPTYATLSIINGIFWNQAL